MDAIILNTPEVNREAAALQTSLTRSALLLQAIFDAGLAIQHFRPVVEDGKPTEEGVPTVNFSYCYKYYHIHPERYPIFKCKVNPNQVNFMEIGINQILTQIKSYLGNIH